MKRVLAPAIALVPLARSAPAPTARAAPSRFDALRARSAGRVADDVARLVAEEVAPFREALPAAGPTPVPAAEPLRRHGDA